ncbi:hypothetical protein [Streptomyces sp. N50]|uniref:hypothetical protein n=1 Tax=Streptomyces sp. N50 TaxID=3081765 RepID=UPI00296220F0|nr:hypothetical protein [Streptomyces sp. N50]WOX10799.1 hypothetical protein R2B38_19055 [Streptomyces sp. N50]
MVGGHRVWDGAFYRVRRDGYEIDDVDMRVIFDNRERWSGTIYTLDVIHRVMDRWRETGECLGGRFFHVRDGRDVGPEDTTA